MQSWILFKKYLVFTGAATVFSFLTIVILLPDEPFVSFAQNVVPMNSGLPVRIRIPAIQGDAAILPVGFAPDGAMGVPEDPSDVAWFKLGPKPGEIGSAVLAGHFGWKDNIPAVFDDLKTLKVGDKIFIENAKGETITFDVQALRTFGEKGNAADVFSSNDGKAHLNLVTCEGVWNKTSKSYSERLVVFADKVDSASSP